MSSIWSPLENFARASLQQRIDWMAQGVVVLEENGDWVTCRWPGFLPGLVAPWLEPLQLVPGKQLSAVFIMLDAYVKLDSAIHYRQEVWAANVAKALRLLQYHPSVALQSQMRWSNAWKAPLIAISWLPVSEIVARHPDLVFLLAQSVKYIAPTDINELINDILNSPDKKAIPQPCTEIELERYFLADLATPPANRHRLGNDIGPLIVAKHLKIPIDFAAINDLPPAALPGIFQQQLLGSRNPAQDRLTPNDIEKLRGDITGKLNGRRVLIIDDDLKRWRPIWTEIFGTQGLHDIEPAWPALMDFLRIPSSPQGDSLIQWLSGVVRESALVVVDLRLLPEETEDGKSTNQLSGFRIVRAIRNCTGSRGKMVPILVFSSSQLQENERFARQVGTDCFLSKPARYDQSGDTKRLLETISLYLDPLYAILGLLRERLDKVSESPLYQKWRREKLQELRDDIEKQIEFLRNELTDFLAPGAPVDKRVDNASICRALELAFAFFQNNFLIKSAIGKAIKNFRNVSAHSRIWKKLPETGRPELGAAVLDAAIQLYSFARQNPDWKSLTPPANAVLLAIESARGQIKTGRSSNPEIKDVDTRKAMATSADALLKHASDPLFQAVLMRLKIAVAK